MRSATYELPWYMLDKKSVFAMKFLVMRSINPIMIMAGKVTPVSLELCVMVCIRLKIFFKNNTFHKFISVFFQDDSYWIFVLYCSKGNERYK